MNEKIVVSKDQAEVEYANFLEAMDLDFDVATMDAEDATAYSKMKAKIVRAVMRGSLAFNENGEAVYTPSHRGSKHSEPLVFHERTGASLMAMDGKKKNQDVSKTYAVMADMCKVHQSVFAGLMGTDVKVCEALFSLLMD